MARSLVRRKSFLIIGGFFSALLLGEVLVRLAVPEWSDQWKLWRVDPTHAVGLYPNTRARVHGISREFAFDFKTNAQGLRMDYDLTENKARGLKRVLFVGDSFTFGYGVNQSESFVSRLQQSLDPTHTKFEMINAGFASGFATDTEFLFTREIGHRWSPDVVVVGVCLGNDFEDVGYNDWKMENGSLVAVTKSKADLPRWQKVSALAGYSLRRLWPLVKNAAKPRRDTASKTEACSLKTDSNRPTKSLGKRLRAIAEMWGEHAAKHNYRLVFLFIPERQEVEGQIEHQELSRNRLVRSQFSAAAFAANAPVWDLTPEMRREACADKHDFYFQRDGHWTADGHRFAADWLSTKLPTLLR
jgi:hypothetical protein